MDNISENAKRLYGMLQDAKCPDVFIDNYQMLKVAEHLDEKGVLASPCKVAQSVYRVLKLLNDEPTIVEGMVVEISRTHTGANNHKDQFYFLAKGEDILCGRYSLWCEFDDIGKTVFFTPQEAEKALAERGKMIEKKTLLPCPFCGKPARMKITKHIPRGYDYTPQCTDTTCCGRLTKKFTDEQMACDAWNLTRNTFADAKRSDVG